MGDGNTGRDDWEMVGAKIRPDMYAQIQEHEKEQNHATESENVRDLLRKGLEASENPGGITPQIAVMWIGTVLLVSAVDWNLQAVNTDWIAVLGFVLLASVVVYSLAEDRIRS